MEVNWFYTEEGFLYHRKASFELGYPRPKSKRKPEKRAGREWYWRKLEQWERLGERSWKQLGKQSAGVASRRNFVPKWRKRN